MVTFLRNIYSSDMAGPNAETAYQLARALWRHTRGTPENVLVEEALEALKTVRGGLDGPDLAKRWCPESCEAAGTDWECATSLAYAMMWYARTSPASKLATAAWLAVGRVQDRKACEPEPVELYEVTREATVSYAEIPRNEQLMLELSGAGSSSYVGSYNARGDQIILRAQ